MNKLAPRLSRPVNWRLWAAAGTVVPPKLAPRRDYAPLVGVVLAAAFAVLMWLVYFA